MAIRLNNVKMMDNVWKVKGMRGATFATKNMNPGRQVYGERLFKVDGVEYREWQHKKSKLASGMITHIRVPSVGPGSSVLYLGASTGTTVSHVSDIVGEDGIVYAVEFAPRPARDLYKLADRRPNIVPIVADARKPAEYAHLVDAVDLVFADVAQPTQSDLFVKNADAFLKSGGQGFIAVKTRSISQQGKPKEIFNEQVKILEKGGFNTIKSTFIGKIHRDHYAYLGNWK